MLCTKCNVDRPLDRFSLKTAGLDRSDESSYRRPCKDCVNEKGRNQSPEWKRRKADLQKKYRAASPTHRWTVYLRQYNLTPERYRELLDAQGGGCAICQVDECSTGHRFSVDHDHRCCPRYSSCGECVRGLLCRTCNIGIGNLGDDSTRLRKAADYLDNWNAR